MAALSLLLFGFAMSALSAPYTQLTIAIPFNYDVPPYLWRDKATARVVGSSIDLQTLMARKLGYKINWRFYHLTDDAQQVTDEFHAGDIDVFINAVPRMMRDEPLISVPNQFHTVSIHCVVAADSPNSDLSLDELLQLRGALTRSDVLLMRMVKSLRFDKANVEILPKAEDRRGAIQRVLEGGADYGIGERYVLLLNAHKWKLVDRLKVVEPPLGYIETSLWFASDSAFIPYQSAYMTIGKKLQDNGQFEHIKQRNMHKYIRLQRTSD